MFYSYFDQIIQSAGSTAPRHTGRSEEGRPIPAYTFGSGRLRVSLIAGCHADEPTGPSLLRHLVVFLSGLPADHPMLQRCRWWIVPQVNPDGEMLNQNWYTKEDEAYDFAGYLEGVQRAIPREDIEYGFPIEGEIGPKRAENEFVFDFWKSADGPFDLHVSLHSMAASFGCWFLIDPGWVERSEALQRRCREEVRSMSYPLFDVDRQGEKGFHRIAAGFATRPNHEAMRHYFLNRDDPETAAYFHPSSMESIRSLGGDCLTLVLELPFFIMPQEEKDLSWPNPAFEVWKDQFHEWKAQLHLKKMTRAEVRKAAEQAGIRAMPVVDQMRLQWTLVCAGGEEVL